jgi:hypothetical protein
MIASVRKMPSVITSRDFPNPPAARNNQSKWQCRRRATERPRCAALKKARSAATQASDTNALLGGIRALQLT